MRDSRDWIYYHVVKNPIISVCRSGGIGRHAWFRVMCPNGCGSSSLPYGTRPSLPKCRGRRFCYPTKTFLQRARQLSRQSNGLKIRVSVVQFHLWPPANNYLYQYFNLNKSCFISRTNQVLQGSTSCILGYKPSTKFYISSTKCLHPHHPYGVPPYLVFLRETQSPEKIFRQQSDCFSINSLTFQLFLKYNLI